MAGFKEGFDALARDWAEFEGAASADHIAKFILAAPVLGLAGCGGHLGTFGTLNRRLETR
jgi:hypothetical protein